MRSIVFELSTVATVIVACSAATLPDGVLEMQLDRIINQTAYGVEMSIGTPLQRMSVKIDTGSPFTGVQGTRSNWCEEESQPCKKYGSYNNETSSTAVYIDSDFYNALINHGSGDHIVDTMRIGGSTIEDAKFGMILNYFAAFPALNPNAGLIGLTPDCKDPKCTEYFPTTIPQKLLKRGVINRNSVGVYLGEEKPTAKGSLLFGGIDRAKQKGTVATYPAKIGNGSPNQVYYSTIAVTTKSGSTTNETKTFRLAKRPHALLDTGNPTFEMPSAVFQYAKRYFGLHDIDYVQGAYKVDCKFREPQADDATLLVGFENPSMQIEIPFSRLVTQSFPRRCYAFISEGPRSGKGCSFGDAFLRSTYSYFDYDNKTITLSNVRYTELSDVVIP